MSHKTQRTSRYMFGTLAQLCENFIFIYLGLSLFTEDQLVYKPMFILVTAVSFFSLNMKWCSDEEEGVVGKSIVVENES